MNNQINCNKKINIYFFKFKTGQSNLYIKHKSSLYFFISTFNYFPRAEFNRRQNKSRVLSFFGRIRDLKIIKFTEHSHFDVFLTNKGNLSFLCLNNVKKKTVNA